MWGNTTKQELPNNEELTVFTLALLFWQVFRFSSWKSIPFKVKTLLFQNIRDQLLSNKATYSRITDPRLLLFSYEGYCRC
jgi:hypothetical protein